MIFCIFTNTNNKLQIKCERKKTTLKPLNLVPGINNNILIQHKKALEGIYNESFLVMIQITYLNDDVTYQ